MCVWPCQYLLFVQYGIKANIDVSAPFHVMIIILLCVVRYFLKAVWWQQSKHKSIESAFDCLYDFGPEKIKVTDTLVLIDVINIYWHVKSFQ